MASKSTIFFILGTVFGGLCSATLALSWPSPSEHGPRLSNATKRSAAQKSTKTPSAKQACPKVEPKAWMKMAQPWLAAGAALNAAQTPDRQELEDSDALDHEAWSPEQEQEFYEQEKEYHQARQEEIEKMRKDLVRKAKLDPHEQGEFLALVNEVTQSLLVGERKLSELMGPLPPFNLTAQDDAPDETQAPELEEAPRLALLQNDFERSKALLKAQTRFEALLGPERLKALGPQFQAVETFIKDEPPLPLDDAPVKGEHAPGSIR